MCIGIVAHNARATHAHQLMEQVGATYMSMDNGTLGCEGNHRKVWDWLAGRDTTWSVVLEDDCVPCDDFTAQLEQVLSVAPTPIVGLYLGTGTPPGWQQDIQTARDNHPDAHWYSTRFNLINAVGVAIRTNLLPLTVQAGLPVDQGIANWCRTNHHTVAYVNPSIVDHRDEQPVIKDRHDGVRRDKPRKAWAFGTRTHWTDMTATL
jgi:hypothetical protein